MYRIVKSDTVELSEGVYVIQEPKRYEAPRKSKAAMSGDGSGNDQDTHLVEDVPQQQDNMMSAEIKALAEQQAEAILLDAAQRAQDSYLETIQRAQIEANALREEAKEQGRVEGAREKKEQIEQCVAQVEQAVVHMESEQAGFAVEYEQKLKWLALEIASKILAKKVEANDTEMVELVRGAVSAAGSAKWVSVEISNQMPALLQMLQASFSQDGPVELRTVNAPIGTCRVETADGVVDASVYTQIANLREYFASEQEE